MNVKVATGIGVTCLLFVTLLWYSGIWETVQVWRFGLAEQIAIPDGTKQEYFPSGKLKNEWRVRDDQIHGLAEEYYELGSIKTRRFWHNGELLIKHRYDENGLLTAVYDRYVEDRGAELSLSATNSWKVVTEAPSPKIGLDP